MYFEDYDSIIALVAQQSLSHLSWLVVVEVWWSGYVHTFCSKPSVRKDALNKELQKQRRNCVVHIKKAKFSQRLYLFLTFLINGISILLPERLWSLIRPKDLISVTTSISSSPVLGEMYGGRLRLKLKINSLVLEVLRFWDNVLHQSANICITAPCSNSFFSKRPMNAEFPLHSAVLPDLTQNTFGTMVLFSFLFSLLMVSPQCKQDSQLIVEAWNSHDIIFNATLLEFLHRQPNRGMSTLH